MLVQTCSKNQTVVYMIHQTAKAMVHRLPTSFECGFHGWLMMAPLGIMAIAHVPWVDRFHIGCSTVVQRLFHPNWSPSYDRIRRIGTSCSSLETWEPSLWYITPRVSRVSSMDAMGESPDCLCLRHQLGYHWPWNGKIDANLATGAWLELGAGLRIAS